jgi:hypothetical protein
MMFESRALKRIFRPKRDELIGGWRKLYKEELHDLYFSPSVIRILKLRKMIWAEYIARNVGGGMLSRYWWESQGERDH